MTQARPTIPRLVFRCDRYGFHLWWRFSPTVDRQIWDRAFGITVRPSRHKSSGELGGVYVGWDFAGWYFGTRIERRRAKPDPQLTP